MLWSGITKWKGGKGIQYYFKSINVYNLVCLYLKKKLKWLSMVKGGDGGVESDVGDQDVN